MRGFVASSALQQLELTQAWRQGAAGGCPDNAGMTPPPAHRILAADVHAVPAPFRTFAVRSDEPGHAFDARPPYARVHVVGTRFLDAAARAGLARAGYAQVDIAEPFAVDYAATSLQDLAAAAGLPGLVGAIAQALRVTRVLGDDLADYERSVATRIDYLASRGAGFHNDVARHWSRSLFWILAIDVADVEFVLAHAGLRTRGRRSPAPSAPRTPRASSSSPARCSSTTPGGPRSAHRGGPSRRPRRTARWT